MQETVARVKTITPVLDVLEEEIIKPNIIFYMNETFWDPTLLDVTFSEDPLKNIRNLREKYPSGSILSPAFGGETANVEFEALTSYSMQFIQIGGLPFSHLLADEKNPSFVRYLNELGYNSEAIHPFGSHLYRRQHV